MIVPSPLVSAWLNSVSAMLVLPLVPKAVSNSDLLIDPSPLASSLENSADWTARYGADPAMEWSRYQPVDPRTFDPDTFGKIGGSAK